MTQVAEARDDRGKAFSHLILPSEIDALISQMQTERSKGLLIVVFYKLFYTEWDAFLGPHPEDPIPPIANFVEDAERLQFVTLYPYGRGHYKGPFVPAEFHKHVVMSIQEPMFQSHKMWLQWTLGYVTDPEVVALVNLVLIVLHGSKARYLGKGNVATTSVLADFPRMKLSKDKKKLVPLTSNE